tara:strand:- start:267 stop:506 length:240 start_codon:yes stop_codon:yes gene_type:complete
MAFKMKPSPFNLMGGTTSEELIYEANRRKLKKDRKMGKVTKPIDKFKAGLDALTSEKTYKEAKQDYRNQRKKEYASKQK